MNVPGVHRKFHGVMRESVQTSIFFLNSFNFYLSHSFYFLCVYLYSNVHNKLVKRCVCAYADTHTQCMHAQIFLADNYKYLETPEKQQLGRGEVVRYPPTVRKNNNDNFVAQ